ncbi:MAG: PrgI family protein [Patescibacteria group bacterium]
MPDQFVVPQFIDAEDKIFGPITVRQFVILMTAALIDGALYKLLSFTKFFILAVIIVVFAGILAFVRINGMPFHFFILNLIQTLRRPGLRVWDKRYTEKELQAFMNEEAPEIPQHAPHKQAMSASRLQELTLVVDTGGVYQPDE